MPHSAGVTVLRTALDPNKPTIAKQLKKAGYTTAVFGKMHFNRPGEPGLHGFDRVFTEGELTRALAEGRQANLSLRTCPSKSFPGSLSGLRRASG